MTLSLQSSAVYGPIFSRRLGVSLGINVLPLDMKFCLSNCIYCQYGPTDSRLMRHVKLRSAEELLDEIKREFERISRSVSKVDAITFSGNGEPTLHPELARLINGVTILRNIYFQKAKIGVLSDSSRVHLLSVREALEKADECYMKLDAGEDALYEKINRPARSVHWESMISGLAKMHGITVQSLFISEPVNNATEPAVKKWLSAIEKIRPKAIHIYTVSRPTAVKAVVGVSKEKLIEIAGLANQLIGQRKVTPVKETFVEVA